MRPTDDNINKLVKKLHLKASADLDKRVREKISKAPTELEEKKSVKRQPIIWSNIMKKPITKFTAAAVIIIVVGILLYTNNSIIPTAYALRDTIEAYNSVSSLHVKENIIDWAVTSENWFEFDMYGNIIKKRTYSPNFGNVLGILTIIGNSDQTQVWLPRFNVHIVGYAPPPEDMGGVFGFDVSQIDPKSMFEELYRQQEQGEIILDINEPVRKDMPILVTVTYPEGSISENWEKILYIDQATKLVKKIEKNQLKDGYYQPIRTTEFSDYNQQFDSAIFSLEAEVPENVFVFDMSGISIGLEQEDMTDKEVADEIIRQFFEAVIAKDYKKAGQLYIGGPESLGRMIFNVLDLSEIISVGPAQPDTDPDSNAMISSARCLLKSNGQIYAWNDIYVKPLPSQSDRWVICYNK